MQGEEAPRSPSLPLVAEGDHHESVLLSHGNLTAEKQVVGVSVHVEGYLVFLTEEVDLSEHDGVISELFQHQRSSSRPELEGEHRPAVGCEGGAVWLLEDCVV